MNKPAINKINIICHNRFSFGFKVSDFFEFKNNRCINFISQYTLFRRFINKDILNTTFRDITGIDLFSAETFGCEYEYKALLDFIKIALYFKNNPDKVYSILVIRDDIFRVPMIYHDNIIKFIMDFEKSLKRPIIIMTIYESVLKKFCESLVKSNRTNDINILYLNKYNECRYCNINEKGETIKYPDGIFKLN